MADGLFQKHFIQKLVLYAHSQEKRDAELLNARSLKQQEQNLKYIQEHIEWSVAPSPMKILSLGFILTVRTLFLIQSIIYTIVHTVCMMIVAVWIFPYAVFIVIIVIHPEWLERAYNWIIPYVHDQIIPVLVQKCYKFQLYPWTCFKDENWDRWMVQPTILLLDTICNKLVLI